MGRVFLPSRRRRAWQPARPSGRLTTTAAGRRPPTDHGVDKPTPGFTFDCKVCEPLLPVKSKIQSYFPVPAVFRTDKSIFSTYSAGNGPKLKQLPKISRVFRLILAERPNLPKISRHFRLIPAHSPAPARDANARRTNPRHRHPHNKPRNNRSKPIPTALTADATYHTISITSARLFCCCQGLPGPNARPMSRAVPCYGGDRSAARRS